jgi:hypothetical protein
MSCHVFRQACYMLFWLGDDLESHVGCWQFTIVIVLYPLCKQVWTYRVIEEMF